MNIASEKIPNKVYVDEFLIDLIPGFIKNKYADLSLLQIAIESDDFETIKKIGHNWKGVCASYGFNYLGEAGKLFESMSETRDSVTLKQLIDSLSEYLKNVQIERVMSEEASTAYEAESLF